MPSFTQLTYASTTNSTPASIRQDLVDILAEARSHNFNHQIYGVLYYGNDYFFQCIQGKKAEVDALYQRIITDQRHHNLALLSYHEISKPSLQGWDMKYVIQDQAVLSFFSQHGFNQFNPYKLEGQLVEAFLDVLVPHDNMEAGRYETVQWSHIQQKGQTIGHYIPWLIVLSTAILLFLMIYYLMPVSNMHDINFFNRP